jgi:hypothetical protein
VAGPSSSLVSSKPIDSGESGLRGQELLGRHDEGGQ